MSNIKKIFKNIIENITGYHILGLGNGSFAMIRENLETQFLMPSSFLITSKSVTELKWTKTIYEHLLKLRLMTLLEKYQIDVVIDVGANEGQYASDLRRFGYQGKIISFEPLSSAFEVLKNAAASDPNWVVYNLALGTENTNKPIFVSDNSQFTSFLKSNDWCEREYGSVSVGEREETVTIRRLDEVLAETLENLDRARIYLKLDTQGYDLEVFKGLGKMHERIVALQSEVSVTPIYQNMPHLTDSILFYEQAGFEVAGMYPVNTEQSGLRIIEFDCVMVSSKHAPSR
jgi:FkbM family methyltransferase